MHVLTLTELFNSWHIGLSVAAAAIIFSLTFIGTKAAAHIPVLREAQEANKIAFAEKMAKPAYAANQAWNRKWSGLFILVVFGIFVPFSITLEPQPWWRVPLDCFVILMVYDFVYYLTHRFTFHDTEWYEGPLKWMHAIHHRQHNPVKWDGSYIHPLEIAIGLGLYSVTIFVLARFMGNFNIVSIVVTFIAFSAINNQNHARWTVDRFPFRSWAYASRMHHFHHVRFTGGNYATITLLYDWLFGTLDNGEGDPRLKRHKGAKATEVPSEA